MITDIYVIKFMDIKARKSFLMLRYSQNLDLTVKADFTYVLDNCKLCVNSKGCLVVVSKEDSVVFEYQKPNIENISESEVSQVYPSDKSYVYQDGQNKESLSPSAKAHFEFEKKRLESQLLSDQNYQRQQRGLPPISRHKITDLFTFY